MESENKLITALNLLKKGLKEDDMDFVVWGSENLDELNTENYLDVDSLVRYMIKENNQNRDVSDIQNVRKDSPYTIITMSNCEIHIPDDETKYPKYFRFRGQIGSQHICSWYSQERPPIEGTIMEVWGDPGQKVEFHRTLVRIDKIIPFEWEYKKERDFYKLRYARAYMTKVKVKND